MSALDGRVIPSNPVLFEGNRPLPIDLEEGPMYPQNLWASIENAQLWTGANILRLHEGADYAESAQANSAVDEQIVGADNKREHDEAFIDDRDLRAIGSFLRTPIAVPIQEEFRDALVLDVGSGAGILSDNLRRHANATVIELDFSPTALRKLPKVYGDRGVKLLADGRQIPASAGQFDRTVSMFSTSLYGDTLDARLRGLTEVLRVTREGGRAFVIPLFANLMLRQNRWAAIQDHKNDPGFYDAEMREYEERLRLDAGLDFATTELLRKLIVSEVVDFTPVLVTAERPTGTLDSLSAVFDMRTAISNADAEQLIQEAFTSVTSDRFYELVAAKKARRLGQ